jgi:Holliday junction resolvase RusA-like endonuclease
MSPRRQTQTADVVSSGGEAMMTVAFTVHGNPAPGGSKRAFALPGGRGIRVVDANKNAGSWKLDVARAASEAMQGQSPMGGPLRLELRFYRSRPKGHYLGSDVNRPLRPSAPEYPATRPDVLKLARAVEDAMTGIVYVDDAQICVEVLHKLYGSPRVEVHCTAAEAERSAEKQSTEGKVAPW